MPFGRKKGKVYNVEYKPRGNKNSPWVVTSGSGSTISRHRKKSAAKRKARGLAKRNKPAELNIYNKNGGFSDGRQYT